MKFAVVSLIFVGLVALNPSESLNCRSPEPITQDMDMEWAVQQCVRQMLQNKTDDQQQFGNQNGNQFGKPNSDSNQNGGLFGNNNQSGGQFGKSNSDSGQNGGLLQTVRGWQQQRPNSNRHSRDVNSRIGGNEEEDAERDRRRQGEGRSGWMPERDANERRNNNRQSFPEGNDYEEPYGDRRRNRGRDRHQPHTTGQQNLYERDELFNKNRRPLFQPTLSGSNNNNNVHEAGNGYNNNNNNVHEAGNGYNNNNNNNNPHKAYNNQGQNGFGDRDNNWQESKLNSIEPCMIHCVFQELQMLDNWGRLNKRAVMEKLTQHVQDRDLRDFLQFTVEDCFTDLEQDGGRERLPGNYGHEDRSNMCRSSKMLAVCLEERGRQMCEDWDEPLSNDSKSKNPNDVRQQNQPNKFNFGNVNNGNSNSNNNNSNNSNREKEVKKGLKPINRG